MKIYRQKDLEDYLRNDWILSMLEENAVQQEESIRTNCWLREMENKRLIYADVYGDILTEKYTGSRILDVGGGVNSLTKILARNTEYTLLEIFAHDNIPLDYFNRYSIHVIQNDWHMDDLSIYDVVIANDLFPDVDQRLELFLDSFLPRCREMRLVVTYYNQPRFYAAKRLDDREILTFLSWDGEITAMKLRKYIDRMMDTVSEDLLSMIDERESIFRNGRQISYIKLRGDL